MKKGSKVDKAAVATAWLSNPAVLYALVGILCVGTIYFLFPTFFGSIKRTFNAGVDTVLSGLADIFGRPKSQDPAERVAGDAVRGLVVEGDRALSDLYDATFGRIFPN